MSICKKRVTRRSDCFKWLMELISNNITAFQFRKLLASLKNLSMLHRAAASELLMETDVDNNGRKTWKLDMYQIMRIEEC